jgi:UDP-3-O-[3-hydroxymyristoyl] glucosamine N-acyltransferase
MAGQQGWRRTRVRSYSAEHSLPSGTSNIRFQFNHEQAFRRRLLQPAGLDDTSSTRPARTCIMSAPDRLQAQLLAWPHLVTRTEGDAPGRRTADRTGTVWARTGNAVCQAANAAYLDAALANDNVCVVIVDERLKSPGASANKLLVFSPRPEELFLRLHLAKLHAALEEQKAPEVHPTADVHPTATLSGNVSIGSGVRIGPNVTVLGPVLIEEGTVIDANAVVGTEGLFAKRLDGRVVGMPHFGGVHIGRDCHVHAGAVIVRSAFFGECTRLGDQAQAGIMCNIGHDSVIGARSILSSNTVIAGRASVGEDCWIGASASIANAIRIGDGAEVMIGAVVIADVPEKTAVSGNFAGDHRRNLLEHMRRTNARGRG